MYALASFPGAGHIANLLSASHALLVYITYFKTNKKGHTKDFLLYMPHIVI